MTRYSFYASLSLYVASAALYLLYALRPGRRRGRVARGVLAVALCFHLGHIGALCQRGQNPFSGITGVLSFSGWLVGLLYLFSTFRWRLNVLGAGVVPLVVVLLASSHLTRSGGTALASRAQLLTGKIHLGLVVAGVSAFALAAGVSILYLWQERAVRRGRIAAINRLIPATTTLDDLARRLVLVGFPLFTLAIATGVLWLRRLPGPRGGFRAEYWLSAAIWVSFAALVVARLKAGVRGRRAALVTLAGFAATTVVLLLYLSRQL